MFQNMQSVAANRTRSLRSRKPQKAMLVPWVNARQRTSCFGCICLENIPQRSFSIEYLVNYYSFKISGDSPNAVPHYQKLCTRLTHIWGNRRGRPNRSAIEGTSNLQHNGDCLCATDRRLVQLCWPSTARVRDERL